MALLINYLSLPKRTIIHYAKNTHVPVGALIAIIICSIALLIICGIIVAARMRRSRAEQEHQAAVPVPLEPQTPWIQGVHRADANTYNSQLPDSMWRPAMVEGNSNNNGVEERRVLGWEGEMRELNGGVKNESYGAQVGRSSTYA